MAHSFNETAVLSHYIGSLLEFLVGLEVVFQRRSLERSVSAHQRLGEVEV
jgi:hypothetical protein